MPLYELYLQMSRSLPSLLRGLCSGWIARVVERHYTMELREEIPQNLKTLSREVRCQEVNARKSAPGFGEAFHEPDDGRICAGVENDWSVCR